jgi:hypothetical protein
MVMSLLGFDNQSATFAYPGATMGAMSAAALSKASHAGEDVEAKLRKAEVEASFRSASHLGFDDLIHPEETRNALLSALQRGIYARQAAAEPVSRTVITPEILSASRRKVPQNFGVSGTFTSARGTRRRLVRVRPAWHRA